MNDFKDISDKYKQQMMDLYKRHPQVIPQNNNIDTNSINDTLENPQPVEETSQNEDTTQNIIPSIESTIPSMESTSQPISQDDIPIEEKFPPPENLPFLNSQEEITPSKDIISNVELKQPNLNSVGYLQVVTTSADQSIPIPDVSVIVSRTVNGNEEILYSLTTNEVGKTPVIELPTVSAEMSQSPSYTKNGEKPYAMYNISTYLNDYFQVKNLNVPIFAGITSIQRVNMIPLPLHTQGKQVITYSETEPNL